MRKGLKHLVIGIMAAALAFVSVNAAAQDFEDRKEVQLSGVEAPKKVERKTLEQEEGSGPKVEFETDEMASARQASEAENADKTEQFEAQQSAIRKLQMRIKNTDEDDKEKPKLMARLGDMLWQKARFYDLRSYEFLAAANAAEDAGDMAKRDELLAKKDADQKTNFETRTEMLKLYQDIIKYHPDYPDMDKIRYYLAFNYAEMGQGADAYAQYSGIVREHANSKYLPEAYLGMAEYTFTIEEDMPAALKQYQKVVSIDASSSAAAYAMYKMGWCYFNLGEPKKALAQFEKVIHEADESGRRTDMRKEAVKDLVKAYSMWTEAKPANAFKYFSSITKDPDEVNMMMERLARLYQESGMIEESNAIYNKLIENNIGKFKIVNYQHEIMLNVETLSNPERLAAEIQRTVRLFVKARDENFEGATPQAVKEESDKLAQYASDTGKWYHMTYQNTKNAIYRSLAFDIYKTYLTNFPDATDSYEVMYYYADMAFTQKDYSEAAKAFERVLDLNDQGRVPQTPETDVMLKDAAHGAVLAYDGLMGENNTNKEACPDMPKIEQSDNPEDYKPLEIHECRLKFIEASKRYARIDTSAEFAINAKYKAAKIYYGYNHFAESRPLFMDITRDAPESEAAVYSANYLLETYRMTMEYEAMRQAITDIKANTRFMNSQQPLMPTFIDYMNNFEEQLDYMICLEKEKNKAWLEAARCMEGYAKNHKDSENAPRARWNAAIDWHKGQDINRSLQSLSSILQDSQTDPTLKDLAPRAMYTIGLDYHELAVYSEAARFYEMFVSMYPNDKEACVAPGAEPSKDPCAKQALANAATFRRGLGEYEKSVEDYDLFAKMFPKDKAEMAMLKFQTGRIYFDQKKYSAAQDRFQEYIKSFARFGLPAYELAAYTYLGKIYTRRGNPKEASKWYEKAESLFSSKKVTDWLKTAAPGDEMLARDAAAEARFMRGEQLFKEVLEIKLQDPSVSPKKVDKFLQTQIQKKSAKLLEATPIYQEVITKYKSPRWGLAALVRLGMMFHDVAHQIETAPTPPGLHEDVEIAYVELLLDFSAQFEEKAIGFYTGAVQKAAETGYFSEYTNEAQKRLFDLRPMEYQSSSEVKATPNKMGIMYHSGKLYTNLDELRGTAVEDDHKVMEMPSEDPKPAEAQPEAAAEPAADAQ